MLRRTLLMLALVFAVACTPKPKVAVVASDDSPADWQGITNGLQGVDQVRWHHLAEGSELYPLAWLLALETTAGKPFLDNPERFGLLPEKVSPENPYGLPVGVTADFTQDLRFAGVKMIGVNCAACHVNELHLEGKTVVRIDGAPNLFDLEAFFGELALTTKATFTDAGKAWRFVRRLYEVYHPAEGNAQVARLARPADDVLHSFETLPAMKDKSALGKRLAQEIETIHKREVARPAENLNKGLTVEPTGPALRAYSEKVRAKGVRTVELTKDLRVASGALRAKSIGVVPAPNVAPIVAETPTSPRLVALAPAARALSVGDALTHFAETIRLLKARAEFLVGLANSNSAGHTAPGFGRVDAFGSARNRFFPAAAQPTKSPVSYPHLWGFERLSWLHWDANTTSVTERNAGQAIGLGALFDPTTFESTLRMDNQKELETLAGKITAPQWPKAFGAIDETKAARGKTLFEAKCAKCHVASSEKVTVVLSSLDKIGTDRLRAESFGVKVGDEEFDVALSRTLKALVLKANGTTPDEKLWRVTKQYAGRPLAGIWATAPYLHNNSVPTLDELLRPVAKRRTTFPVGHREYDPKKLGYADKAGSPTFLFDTTQPGNSNAGHDSPEYGTDMNDDQRKDLLEYLKQL